MHSCVIFPPALELERRDELDDKANELKDCLGIDHDGVMTKIREPSEVAGNDNYNTICYQKESLSYRKISIFPSYSLFKSIPN